MAPKGGWLGCQAVERSTWREAREQEGNGGDRHEGDDGLCLGGQERGSDSCLQGDYAGVQLVMEEGQQC